jgi:hypothetical protein
VRIERLAADNPRTQGPTRRQWYQRHSAAHLRGVADAVERALTLRAPEAPQTAVVLGAGACTEVPLERLARACGRVVLVDLDMRGMEQAWGELPASMRGNVELVAVDLAGGVSEALDRLLREQPWADLARLSRETVAGAAASCLDRVAVPDPPSLPELGTAPIGLVMSALVLTQLFSLPLLDLLDALAVVAPHVLLEEDARYRKAAQDFRWRVAVAHLNLLATLIAPGGAGVLVSDETGYLLAPTSGAHAHEPKEALALLPPDVVDLPRDLEARFQLVDKSRQWRWLVTAPTAEQPGRAYDVVGVAFRSPRGRSNVLTAP